MRILAVLMMLIIAIPSGTAGLQGASHQSVLKIPGFIATCAPLDKEPADRTLDGAIDASYCIGWIGGFSAGVSSAEILHARSCLRFVFLTRLLLGKWLMS
jgi:hypothetical protein